MEGEVLKEIDNLSSEGLKPIFIYFTLLTYFLSSISVECTIIQLYSSKTNSPAVNSLMYCMCFISVRPITSAKSPHEVSNSA
jgi:hypothetical protein